IASVKRSGTKDDLSFEHNDNTWQVTAAAAKFPADQRAMSDLLNVWSNLKADRFAAYGPKIDTVAFGLDKPSATGQIAAKKAAANGKEAPKAEEHRLDLGKPVAKEGGERYARLDNGPGIFVLNSAAAATLERGYLDYVDHSVFKFEPG